MADESQQAAVSAAYPAPPFFSKSFTSENVEQLNQLPSPGSTGSHGHAQNLPPGLRRLKPPQTPSDGTYASFGVTYDITPVTTSAQTVPTRSALLSLSDRLLQTFLRYVQILGTSPSGLLWVPQWEEIRKTFEETHKIINEYRPQQARETLLLMVEDQIKQYKDETQRIRSSVARAREVMESLDAGNGDGDAKSTNDAKTLNDTKETFEAPVDLSPEMLHRIWEIVDRDVGAP